MLRRIIEKLHNFRLLPYENKRQLTFYQGLKVVYSALKTIKDTYSDARNKDIRSIHQLLKDLQPLIDDEYCKRIMPIVLEKNDVSDRLRNAMRITYLRGQ